MGSKFFSRPHLQRRGAVPVVTVAFASDLDTVKINHHAEHLGQRNFDSYYPETDTVNRLNLRTATLLIIQSQCHGFISVW